MKQANKKVLWCDLLPAEDALFAQFVITFILACSMDVSVSRLQTKIFNKWMD